MYGLPREKIFCITHVLGSRFSTHINSTTHQNIHRMNSVLSRFSTHISQQHTKKTNNFIMIDVWNLFFTVNIVGTNIDDYSFSCSVHCPLRCGVALHVNDWVVFCFILLDNEGLHENAIKVCKIIHGEGVLSGWISPVHVHSPLRAL